MRNILRWFIIVGLVVLVLGLAFTASDLKELIPDHILDAPDDTDKTPGDSTGGEDVTEPDVQEYKCPDCGTVYASQAEADACSCTVVPTEKYEITIDTCDSYYEEFELYVMTNGDSSAVIDVYGNGNLIGQINSNETSFLGDMIPKDGVSYEITLVARGDNRYLESDPYLLGEWRWFDGGWAGPGEK